MNDFGVLTQYLSGRNEEIHRKNLTQDTRSRAVNRTPYLWIKRKEF